MSQSLSYLIQRLKPYFLDAGVISANLVWGRIILMYDNQAPASSYDPDDAGLAAALADATASDAIWMPPGTWTIDVNIPQDVAIAAMTNNTIFTGKVTLNAYSSMKGITVLRTANDANPLIGVVNNGANTAWLNDCAVQVTQSGTGSAIALSIENAGTTWVWGCELQATSVGGTGYGISQTAGACFLSDDGYVHGSTQDILGMVTRFDYSDEIKLFDSAGANTKIYPPTGTGLTAALAAATAGDVVQLPAGTITITAAITVPAGVALNGITRTNSTIQATTDIGTAMITVNGTMTYINALYNLTAHNGGVWLRAVTVGTGGLVTFSSGRCTNTGNTPAYGLDVQTGATSSRSDFYAICTGGLGVGIRIAGTARYMRGEGYDSTTSVGISVVGGTCEYSAAYANTSTTKYDLYVPSGTAIIRWCSSSANGDLTVAVGATAYLYANQYDTLVAGGTVYWERGDRQAFHWYDVRLYGAAGDGVTDDTAAIAAAIAAIPATGGVLYFSPGAYVTSGGFVLNKPITVRGDGGSAEYNDPTTVSKVTCNSRTAILFEVTEYGCSFHDLMMINTAALQPTAGAGIQITAGGDLMHFENLYIDGFYIDLDAQDGWSWEMKGCWIYNPVKYGLKMAHPDLPDGGNQNIVNSYFMVVQSVSANTPDAMIRIESGGAPKIVNCKINSDVKATYGIDIAVPQNVETVIFLISNSSIENILTDAIHIATGAAPSNWDHITIVGCHFGLYNIGAGGRAININANTSGDIDGVIIANNILYTSGGAPANEAILLTNVNHARICGNYQEGWVDLATEVTCTDVDYCATTGDLHDPVTLDIDAAVILDLTGQEIGLDVQNANTVFAGPTTGAANEPTFRALVSADLPSGDMHGHVIDEDHSAECDDLTVAFATSYDFLINTTAVYLNGLRQRLSIHYTEDVTLDGITFITAPETGDELVIDYIVSFADWILWKASIAAAMLDSDDEELQDSDGEFLADST